MKNLFLLIFIGFSVNLFAQEIPNSSFENWVDEGNYLNPEHWDTGNRTDSGVTTVTTSQTTDSNSGEYAAKIETVSVMTFTAPGLVTLGEFNLNIWTQVTSITGGIAFTDRPENLQFYYKYNPASGDNMRVGMWLLRDDGTEIPDTVGTALFESTEQVDEYTLISIPIEYRSEETPEILNIIATSSNPDDPVAGSELYIDDFAFEYPVGIISLNDYLKDNLIYPNPANDMIFLEEKLLNTKINIYDIKGKLVYQNINQNEEIINISNFNSGVYILKSFSEDKLVFSNRFIKK